MGHYLDSQELDRELMGVKVDHRVSSASQALFFESLTACPGVGDAWRPVGQVVGSYPGCPVVPRADTLEELGDGNPGAGTPDAAASDGLASIWNLFPESQISKMILEE